MGSECARFQFKKLPVWDISMMVVEQSKVRLSKYFLIKKMNRKAFLISICILFVLIANGQELTRNNFYNNPTNAWQAVQNGAESPMPLLSLTPAVLLPDGIEFKTWEQEPEYQRTFYVAKESPNASDDNPGTEELPWKTIGKAASFLEPGDRVIVKEGIYREWVRPLKGGVGPQKMITYQAAQNEEVIISGSEPLTGRWQQSRKPVSQSFPGKVWMIDLPSDLFDGYNPFAETNATENLMTHPSAISQGWDKPPYTLSRGLVFQNGTRLMQIATYEDLDKEDGTYWVDMDKMQIYVRPLEDKNPKKEKFEVTTRPFAISPEKAGLGFICVDGFTVENVANCYPVPQLGAISTKQGHHWILKNNIIRHINGIGMDFGWRQTFLPYEVPEDTPKLAGVGTIVRNNSFYDCGICSMQGLGITCALIEDNYIQDCCWHNVEQLWEAAAIKLHWMKHTLVRRNIVNRTIGAPGIWLDHSIANVRLTKNIIVGVQSPAYGGIFLEASYKPNLIDRNIVWDCEAYGFYQHNCNDLTVANNLIGNCTKAPVFIQTQTEDRQIDIETKRMSVVIRNTILGNVFYGFGDLTPVLPGGNISDFNLFVNPPGGTQPDLSICKEGKGQETNSTTFSSEMDFSLMEGTLDQSLLLPEFLSPRIFEITTDFFETPLDFSGTTQAGPFLYKNIKPKLTVSSDSFKK